jgi:hypothetical protein
MVALSLRRVSYLPIETALVKGRWNPMDDYQKRAQSGEFCPTKREYIQTILSCCGADRLGPILTTRPRPGKSTEGN